MGDSLATIDMDRKRRGLLRPFRRGGEIDPRLTQYGHGLRYTSVSSGILIHPAVKPQ